MIKIICVGQVKEKFFRESIQEYQKRIQKYTKLKIIEVNDSKIENPSIAMKKESELIKKYIKSNDYIITLEINGNKLTSIDLANKINEIQIHYSNITFIIGGSYGLAQEIKDLSNYSLSFSKLTFPHQLFRIILLEQIYRSYRILNNESYHK